jgi:hypothetical protein
MVFGKDFQVWDRHDQDDFTFTKSNLDGTERLLVFLSFSDDMQPLHYPTGLANVQKELLIVENQLTIGLDSSLCNRNSLDGWGGRV